MSRGSWIRWGKPAAVIGGALYLAAFGATYLIYERFAKEAEGTFFASHAFIHIVDVAAFALLFVGAVAVYSRQSGRLGRVGKAGFYATLAGFGLSVVGGLTIIAVGLAVSDEATLGVLDAVTHPLAHLLYALGSLVFGISTFRAGVLPRGGALLAAIGPVWLFAMFLVGANQSFLLLLPPVLATGLGWAWLGSALTGEGTATVGEPQVSAR